MATAAHRFFRCRTSRPVTDWVESVRELTQPDAVHWCEGPMRRCASSPPAAAPAAS